MNSPEGLCAVELKCILGLRLRYVTKVDNMFDLNKSSVKKTAQLNNVKLRRGYEFDWRSGKHQERTTRWSCQYSVRQLTNDQLGVRVFSKNVWDESIGTDAFRFFKPPFVGSNIFASLSLSTFTPTFKSAFFIRRVTNHYNVENLA